MVYSDQPERKADAEARGRRERVASRVWHRISKAPRASVEQKGYLYCLVGTNRTSTVRLST